VYTCLLILLLVALGHAIAQVAGPRPPLRVPVVLVAVHVLRDGAATSGLPASVRVAPRQDVSGYTDVNGIFVALVARTAPLAVVRACSATCVEATTALPTEPGGAVLVTLEVK
jgi:hypothetical protein